MSWPAAADPAERTPGAWIDRYPVATPAAEEAGAAVLIVLRSALKGDDVEALLIQRTERESDSASGQVSLPGGRVGPSDRNLQETVLRETLEEVGIGAGDLRGPPRYVGRRRAQAFGLDVAVFTSELETTSAARIGSPEEVADVFWLPRHQLLADRRLERPTRHGSIEVDAVEFDGHVIWGFTRRVLREFFGLDPGEVPGPMPPVRVAHAGPEHVARSP